MSEAELHILKARMHEGRRAKARVASWCWACRAAMCASRPARSRSIPTSRSRRSSVWSSTLFERRRSVSGVLRYLVDHDIRLPDRIRPGPHKGEVRWNRPNRGDADATCCATRLYAGAYVYGRRPYDHRLHLPGKPHSGRRFLRDPEHWKVLHQGLLAGLH